MGENKKSIIVVADTHFGLNHEDESCDPKAFGDFLKWIKSIERGKEEKSVQLGAWRIGELDKLIFSRPEQLILLGDIIELWDASNESIFCSIQNIIQKLSELDCKKIYVLGNHDHDISDLSHKDKFSYPLGNSEITIVKNKHEISKGGLDYRFVHGHQFDKTFRRTLGLWQVMGPIRKVALAFGKYSWILFALLAINIALGFTGLGNFDMMTALLGSLSVPFVIQKFGRKILNIINKDKFNPIRAQEHASVWNMSYEDQWREYLNLPPLTVVYGHTHTINTQEEYTTEPDGIERVVLETYTLPSWVCNSSDSKKGAFKQISNVFLYIDPSFGAHFVGWDKTNERPYYIPRNVVVFKRKNGNLSNHRFKVADFIFDTADTMKDELKKIGWTQELIDEWDSK